MKFYKSKILKEDGYLVGSFEIENGKFKSFSKDSEEYKYIVIPGFFDIHTHGAVGYDFTTANKEEMKEILKFYKSHGITSVFPTLLTEHDELIFKQLETLYEISKSEPIIKGIHLEGPFLSKVFKGAQLEECLQVPSIEKCKLFIEHSHGLFKYMTIAPERENSCEIISFLTKNDIKVSMGHSNASFDETTNALKAGASCITHTMNAMKGLNHHDPSILAAALYYDDLYNEVILDGIHVHPKIVEFIRKIKGNDRVIAITDSLMAAGLPDGNYMIGNTPITVKDHDCKISATGVRAGSTLNMEKAFTNIKKFCCLNDLEASKITSLNASKMLGLNNKIGSIEVGKHADFIIMDKNYKILETYINGQLVYKNN